jgi:hypothetical protein
MAMQHVVIKTVDESPGVAFPALDGVIARGSISTRSVIVGADRPLLLWVHEMAPGSSIAWAAPKVGHVAYAWKGSVNANGQALETESVVVVEHGGNCTITAGAGGATLVHYHQSEALPNMTTKAGGHVHLVDSRGLHRRDDAARNTLHTVWADAHCPTCDLWLHKSAFGISRPQGEPHMHNAHEIIFVTSGRVVVGRTHAAGTAVAVDADTIYGFGVDEGGAAFINFRPGDPCVRMTAKGKPLTDWMSEYDYMVKGGVSPATRHLGATQPG